MKFLILKELQKLNSNDKVLIKVKLFMSLREEIGKWFKEFVVVNADI